MVWQAAIPALVSGAASLAGGFMNRQASQDANAQSMAMAQQNMAQQREFAQNGIRWRVEDAKAAGIHPLYALGAQVSSFSPVSVGSTADNSMGNAVANMGQDIGRAIQATRTDDERMSAYTSALSALQLERGSLENDLLRSKIALLQQQRNPALPSLAGHHALPGQGDSSKGSVADPGAVYSAKGTIPDTQFSRTSSGLAAVPSKEMQEAIEDMPLASIPWSIRNQILPTFQGGQQPPAKSRMISDGFLPKGTDLSQYEWRYNPANQEWSPRKVSHTPWFSLKYNNRQVF